VDQQRYDAGQRLLDAAYEFWSACQAEGQAGAIQWLLGSNGELVIFTRGEYLSQLMANIAKVDASHYFGERMMVDEDPTPDKP